MPSIIDGAIIEKCSGTVNLGDKYNIHPISMDKGYNGSGAANSAKYVKTFNGIAVSNINDSDKNDGGINFSL